MKEIIVFEGEALKLKLLILENSISFVEEYFKDSQTEIKSNNSHYNVPIEDIQRIKYSSSDETTKTKRNPVPFILAVMLLFVTIVLAATKLWVPMAITAVIAIIVFVVGFVSTSPEQRSTSQTLVIEGEEKTLYSKKVNLTEEKLLEIINSIRDKQ